jgi:uncharacterized protein YciI
MHWLLLYTTSPDYLERRGEFRERHLAHAWAAVARGDLLLGGAVGDPPERALLLFECDSPDVPADFARSDPYVSSGLVTHWEVKVWSTVVGESATSPVLRPA